MKKTKAMMIMAAMLLAITIIVLFLSQWLTKPVEEMSSTITQIKNGETQLRVRPVGWSQELTTLGTEFNANFPGIVILNLISYIIKLVFSL